MRTIWKVLLVAAGAVLVILAAAFVVFGLFWTRYGGIGGMMPYYGVGPMMRGFAPWMWAGGFGVVGFLMMLVMMGIPAAILALLIVGVVALLRRPAGGPPVVPPDAPPAARACPNCGRPVQADWANCPYCGAKI